MNWKNREYSIVLSGIIIIAIFLFLAFFSHLLITNSTDSGSRMVLRTTEDLLIRTAFKLGNLDSSKKILNLISEEGIKGVVIFNKDGSEHFSNFEHNFEYSSVIFHIKLKRIANWNFHGVPIIAIQTPKRVVLFVNYKDIDRVSQYFTAVYLLILLGILFSIFLLLFWFKSSKRTRSGDNLNDETIGDAIKELNTKVFENPFLRLKSHELAVFPKKTKKDGQDFLIANSNNYKTELLMLHFDLVNFDTGVAKHRIHEQFLSLSNANISADQIAHALWKTMFSRISLGPGFLYVRASSDKLTFFQSGPFFLYIKEENEVNTIHKSTPFFRSEYDGLDTINFEGNAIIVSKILFDLLDIDEDILLESVLKPLPYKIRAKEQLTLILQKVYILAKEKDLEKEYPGLISVFSRKS